GRVRAAGEDGSDQLSDRHAPRPGGRSRPRSADRPSPTGGVPGGGSHPGGPVGVLRPLVAPLPPRAPGMALALGYVGSPPGLRRHWAVRSAPPLLLRRLRMTSFKLRSTSASASTEPPSLTCWFCGYCIERPHVYLRTVPPFMSDLSMINCHFCPSASGC